MFMNTPRVTHCANSSLHERPCLLFALVFLKLCFLHSQSMCPGNIKMATIVSLSWQEQRVC